MTTLELELQKMLVEQDLFGDGAPVFVVWRPHRYDPRDVVTMGYYYWCVPAAVVGELGLSGTAAWSDSVFSAELLREEDAAAIALVVDGSVLRLT